MRFLEKVLAPIVYAYVLITAVLMFAILLDIIDYLRLFLQAIKDGDESAWRWNGGYLKKSLCNILESPVEAFIILLRLEVAIFDWIICATDHQK